MLQRLFAPFVALLLCGATDIAFADAEQPDVMIGRLSAEVVELAKEKCVESGDVAAIMALVDRKLMPNVDFNRMTAAAVGRPWREASPEQQARLKHEFKTLLVRSYAGVLNEARNLTISVRPLRMAAEDSEVTVRTAIHAGNGPIQLDYRMQKTADGWKIYDLNVLGVWLAQSYRGQFAAEIQSKGIDGLIAALSERNNKASTKG